MRFIMLFVLFISLPVSLSAQGASVWVESQNIAHEDGNLTTQVNVSVSKKYSDNLGVFLWTIGGENWSEAIVGGLWSPNSSIEFGLGAGIERNVNPGRALGSVFAASGHVSLLAVGEHGGGGSWYMVQGNYSVSRFGLGFRAQRFVGIGPRFEVNALGRLKLWVVPYTFGLESERDGNTIVSLRFTL